jgi:hypothetical protein
MKQKKPAKKPVRSKLVRKLDVIFSQYIRNKYANKKGMVKCFTCDREYPVKNIQNGHFMSRKHYSTRWHEDNCRPQCYSCNVMQGGQQYIFAMKLGKELSDEMYQLSREIVKFSNYELEEMIEYYQKELKKLL